MMNWWWWWWWFNPKVFFLFCCLTFYSSSPLYLASIIIIYEWIYVMLVCLCFFIRYPYFYHTRSVRFYLFLVGWYILSLHMSLAHTHCHLNLSTNKGLPKFFYSLFCCEWIFFIQNFNFFHSFINRMIIYGNEKRRRNRNSIISINTHIWLVLLWPCVTYNKWIVFFVGFEIDTSLFEFHSSNFFEVKVFICVLCTNVFFYRLIVIIIINVQGCWKPYCEIYGRLHKYNMNILKIVVHTTPPTYA